ncbi:hypothetical protein BDV29DRAFT_194742 [Aspergillus leporis]|uniref:PQ loop repeat-domain-containing protein n=1 Tax=Aspergillus leporis TaxID=41062 RepID=A0A5N5WM91_9EURO|nr:hypothetical protein BDV29DRAFT_194742 [Aspergillus leporis]
MDAPIAANVLGTIGALISQIIINYRRHNTEGLQGSMMLLWAVAGVPLGVYNIVEEFNKVSISECVTAVVPLLVVLGALEVALVFALQAAKRPGVLRHYWDIYIHRTVRGISFISVGIDAAGDLFSLISVLCEPRIDILGMVIYGIELALWLGIFACGGIFNFMPWVLKLSQKRDLNELEQVSIHPMSSSTSVFRTVSSSDWVTRRVAAAAALPLQS